MDWSKTKFKKKEHAEITILSKLPEMLEKIGGVDSVYLFTRSSPCCRIDDENNKTPVNNFPGYFKCVKESCAVKIANFKKEHKIPNFYVSWSKPYYKEARPTATVQEKSLPFP